MSKCTPAARINATCRTEKAMLKAESPLYKEVKLLMVYQQNLQKNVKACTFPPPSKPLVELN